MERTFHPCHPNRLKIFLVFVASLLLLLPTAGVERGERDMFSLSDNKISQCDNKIKCMIQIATYLLLYTLPRHVRAAIVRGVIVDCADVVVLKFLCQMVAWGFSGLDVIKDVSRQKWLRLCSAAAESLAA